MLVEKIVRLERAGVGILLDEKDRRQLLQKLHDPQQKVAEWHLRNICYNTLHGRSTLRFYEHLHCSLFCHPISTPGTT